MPHNWMDWIIPIIIIVISIAQWLGKDKKRTPPISHSDTPDLGDLFEALGKRANEGMPKSVLDSPPPVTQKTPPVVPKQKPSVAPRSEKISVPQSVKDSSWGTEEKHLTELPEIAHIPQEKALCKKEVSVSQHEPSSSLGNWISDVSVLRKSIIMKEILDAPVGLKPWVFTSY
ncbi:MAG: hypothetical protein ACOY3I_05540 [Verrucomicrobiota bacterium]